MGGRCGKMAMPSASGDYGRLASACLTLGNGVRYWIQPWALDRNLKQ
ncbi:MAG: hypothetical protein KAV83_09820 [Desulfobacterales bacterium]|nr:hypothetical protein [Desulfobacterales bacterium]